MHRAIGAAFGVAVAVVLVAGGTETSGRQELSASDGWLEMPAPGDTDARVFAVVKNPTMYDVYIVSATSSVAGKVEFRNENGGEAKTVSEITVPAYGSQSMEPGGIYLVLIDLKRPLKEAERVSLTLTTDGSIKLPLNAVVRAE